MDTTHRDEPNTDDSSRGFESSDRKRESLNGARRRKRRKSPVRDGAPLSGLDAAVRAAFANLDAATRALARAQGLEGRFRGVEVRLRLGNGEHPDRLSEDFLRELLSRLDEARAAEEFVVPNRAYCLRCESFLCQHSRPRDPREVMAGYEPTGRPLWSDFLSTMFDKRDARSESVADRSSGIVTVVTAGADLTRGRIEAFGGESPEVEVLCQVAAGYFPLNGNGDEEAAVTIQLLKVRTPAGARLVLNPIGDPRLLNAAGDHDLSRILSNARSLTRKRVPTGSRDLDAAFVNVATSLANDLARDLQHCFQVRARRTIHARERAAIGVRPTSHAFPEARAAADSDIRVDSTAETFVLLGKNSRVHFFNREGRHVTSVRFNGETIRARLDTGRWRAAEPKEIAQFRARIAHAPTPPVRGDGDPLDRK